MEDIVAAPGSQLWLRHFIKSSSPRITRSRTRPQPSINSNYIASTASYQLQAATLPRALNAPYKRPRSILPLKPLPHLRPRQRMAERILLRGEDATRRGQNLELELRASLLVLFATASSDWQREIRPREAGGGGFWGGRTEGYICCLGYGMELCKSERGGRFFGSRVQDYVWSRSA
jgi:hypothetical protein